ncbi:hypothetical protein [Sulfurimonas diazotrophicus]|uniref:Uncharacterized protein n=1 Tax=Sulfurimonas diazotrophicus TaxID=3131939 RepID=A0ABZ3HD54_9BACT
MDEKNTSKIDVRLKSIETKIDQILPEVENVLAQRVYLAAKEKLSTTAKYFSLFVALLLGAIGYQSYKEIVDIGGTKVAEAIAKSVIPELQRDVETQVDARLEELMVEARSQANAKMDQKIAEVSAAYEEKFNLLLKQIKTNKHKNFKVISETPKLHGFALYGEGGKNENGEWVWSSKNFNLEHKDVDTLPTANQSALATKAVLVREQPPSIRYETREIKTKVPVMKGLQVSFKNKVISSTKIPILEENSGKVVGTIQAGKKVDIKSVQTVLEKYVWVSFDER